MVPATSHVKSIVAALLADSDGNINSSKRQFSLKTYIFEKREVALELIEIGACIDPQYEKHIFNRSKIRLWTAVLRGDLDELRRRIGARDSVDQAPLAGEAKDWTALWLAVILGREDAARMLIKAGADVNCKAEFGLRPLMLASRHGMTHVVDMLINRQAELNVKAGDSNTALHFAVKYGHLNVVRQLVDAGADLNVAGERAMTPLMLAINEENNQIFDYLLQSGAEIHTFSIFVHSPIQMALSTQQFDVVDRLLEAGVAELESEDPSSPHSQFMDRVTLAFRSTSKITDDVVLDSIVRGNRFVGGFLNFNPTLPSDVIRAFIPQDTSFWSLTNNDAPMLAAELAGGLDPNMKTENGMTLLHWACACDAPDCVQLLLDAGADKDALATFFSKKLTAYEYAKTNSPESCEILERY